MKRCHPSMLISEIYRQGGSVRVGLGELKFELPDHLQTAPWLEILKLHKSELIDYLTTTKIDPEDYEAHIRWSQRVGAEC